MDYVIVVVAFTFPFGFPKKAITGYFNRDLCTFRDVFNLDADTPVFVTKKWDFAIFEFRIVIAFFVLGALFSAVPVNGGRSNDVARIQVVSGVAQERCRRIIGSGNKRGIGNDE